MIRRSDITTLADGTTPQPGVYVTVKNADGTLASIYDDSLNLIANSRVLSDANGVFAYNANPGEYYEEFRLSLLEQPRKVYALTLGGAASSIRGDSPTIFQILSSDGTPNYTANNVAPFVSVNGTRTSKNIRIVVGNGTDLNFDSTLTANGDVIGVNLYRDFIQDNESFLSTGGDGARATLDMFPRILGTTALNHYRGTQFRPHIMMTGTPLISELVAHQTQPILDGTFNVDFFSVLSVKNPQYVSGTQNFIAAYVVYVEDCPNYGANFSPIGIFSTKPNYIGGHIQQGTTADLYGGREVRAKAIQAVGPINSFQASGGVALYAPGGGSAAVLLAYTDAGGTPGNLAVTGAQTLFGTTTGTVGAIVEINGQAYANTVRPKSYTVATVPSAVSSGAGATVYVSNEAGGATLAFSNGTNWKRVSDLATIS